MVDLRNQHRSRNRPIPQHIGHHGDMVPTSSPATHRTSARLIVMVVVGAIAAVVTGSSGSWAAAPVVGWAAAALVYTVWVWSVIGRMDAGETASHAVREDPSRGTSDLLVLVAALASLAAVALVLIEARQTSGGQKATYAGLAVAGVVLSWLLVHTLFTLRYASIYYRSDAPSVGFNQHEKPQYTDFAYIAFGVGMTYQIADTDVQNHAMRVAVLRHSLLSYIFGSVILATTINLVVGLTG